MGELGLNKIFGAILATALGIMGLQQVSASVFGGGGHHGAHTPQSLNEWAQETFHYTTEIPEIASGAGPVVEEVFDLGLALANADLARGERSLKGKCVSCHTWDEGGANGTGPNLYNVVGRDIGGVPGFGYSGAFEAYPGNWTYEELDGFLKKPSKYISGTAMSFNGLSKDPERAAVIAYLASVSPNAPAFPAPLPSPEDNADAGLEDAILDAASNTEGAIEEVVEAVSDVTQTAVGGGRGALEAIADSVEAAGQSGLEALDDAADVLETPVEEVGDRALETEH